MYPLAYNFDVEDTNIIKKQGITAITVIVNKHECKKHIARKVLGHEKEHFGGELVFYKWIWGEIFVWSTKKITSTRPNAPMLAKGSLPTRNKWIEKKEVYLKTSKYHNTN